MRAMRLCVLGALLVGACGGSDWHSVDNGSGAMTVIDLWVFSPTDVWFLDGTATIHRYDGSSWTTLQTPSTRGLGCIYALSTTDVYLCAGNAVLRYDGATFTSMEVAMTTNVDNLVDLWASAPGDIWAIGDSAIIAHYNGTTWTGTNTGATFASSVWGSGPQDVYVLGTFDLMHYDGMMWGPVTLDPSASGGDGQVWGTGASDVWVMTDSYALSHFNGSAWTVVETNDFVGDLAAVWGPAPNDLWAAGSAGSIAHYDGSSWDEVTHQTIGSPYLRVFVAVHGSSSTDVWAVGYQLGEGGSKAVIYHHEP